MPLPQEVVSDECIAVLEAACAAKDVIIKSYIARALAAEPVVDMLDATVCGTRHQPKPLASVVLLRRSRPAQPPPRCDALL